MKFSWDDILIVGDSFCANRGREYEWPQVLVCDLTGEQYIKGREPRGQGFPGASWWSTRNSFIEEIKRLPTKLVVFCHTDSNRIPSDTNQSLNAASSARLDKALGQAVDYYYGYLVSHDFHNWAQKSWFLEAELLCKQYGIKAIHIHCFDSNYVFGTGLTVKEIWCHRAVTGAYNPYYTDVSNHFVPVVNKKLGQNLAKLVKQWSGETGTVIGTLFDDSGFLIKES